MQRSSSSRVWLAFLLLALAWGSSYLWIKIGLGSLTPLELISGRLVIGAAFLAIVVAVARQELPRTPRMYGHLLVMSVINIVIPFILIAIGVTLSSSLLLTHLIAQPVLRLARAADRVRLEAPDIVTN